MRQILYASLLLTIATSAVAQNCPEGRTANGQCVNAGLANSMRQDALIFSQPKISSTAFPILPSQDYDYRYPHNVIPDPNRPASIGTAFPSPAPSLPSSP